MSTSTTKSVLSRMFTLLALLFLVAQVGADPGSTAINGESAEVQVAALAPSPTAMVSAEPAACATQEPALFANAIEAVVQQNASCNYTCPFNMVMLCPDFLGYEKACRSGCCVYF